MASWPIWLVLALAFLFRVAIWYLIPYHGNIIDEQEYSGAAAVLADGRGFSFFDTSTWLRPPLYIVFLAGFFRFLGYNLTAARIGQTVLSVGSVYLVYLLGRDLGGPRAGLAAAIIVSVFLPLAVLPYLLLSETVFVFLFLLAFVALVRSAVSHLEGGRPFRRELCVYLVAGGTLLGFTALTRSVALAFLPLVLVWFLVSWRPKLLALGYFAIVAGSCFVIIAPWTARNYYTYHRFLPIDNTSGYDFWLGTTGLRGQAEVEETFKSIPNQADRQTVGLLRGLENISSDPGAFLRKGTNEVLDLWRINFGADERFVKGYTRGEDSPAYLLTLFTLDDTLYLAVGVLSAIGLIQARRHPATLLVGLWILYLSATAFVFFAVTRFRIPILPFLAVYAGYLIANLSQMRKQPLSWVNTGPSLGLGLAFLIIVAPSYPVSDTVTGIERWYEQNHLALGDDYLREGRVAQAIAEYEQANTRLPETHVALAEAYKRENKPQEALAELKQAGESYYGTAVVRGDLYRSLGEVDLARAEFGSRVVNVANPTAWAWDHLRPPDTDEIDIGGMDLGYIKDFEGSEKEGQTTFRWTRESSQLRFLPAPSSGNLTLELRLRGWRPEGARLPSVAVSVNGVEVGRFTASPQWETRRLDVAESIEKQGPLVVQMWSDIFVTGGQDPRRLGVMVDWARLLSD